VVVPDVRSASEYEADMVPRESKKPPGEGGSCELYDVRARAYLTGTDRAAKNQYQ
jgi:hypothetical protein